jgi:uncharacterized protein (TIGR02145 family)
MIIIFAAIITVGNSFSCIPRKNKVQEVTLIEDEIDVYEDLESVTDIDENEYKTVKIGEQVWMAKNLNTSRFRNGDEILEVKNYFEWRKAYNDNIPAWCYFYFDSKNGEVVGKHYNWYAITDPRGLAPEGFHIPNLEEWTVLIDLLGSDATTKLKNKTGWPNNDEPTNISGFSGLPGGFYGSISGITDFYQRWEAMVWWSTTRDNEYLFAYGAFGNHIGLDMGLPVRCIKDM